MEKDKNKDNPFAYINAICKHEDMKVGEDYSRYLTSRYFSYFVDTVLFANEINGFSENLNDQLHFDYYIGLIKRKRRNAVWHKAKDHRDLLPIVKYYDISFNEARLYSPLIDDDMYYEIVKIVDERHIHGQY